MVEADGVPVPPVDSEELSWSPADPDSLSRREVQRQTGTFRAAIVSDLAGWQAQIPAELQADVDDATGALARVDGFAAERFGPNALMGSPMRTILLRTESASSSQIEQLSTSALQLALAAINEVAKPNAAAVLGNVHAMEHAIAVPGKLSVESILLMHRALLADFVPPTHPRLPAAMDDLVAFIAREDLPVLVQAAVAHAQFETIHPFVDGNGRTGRALIHTILKEKGLVTAAVTPLSAGLLIDVRGYFDALAEFRKGDAGPIIAQFASAARFASRSARKLMDELSAVLRELEGKLEGVRRDSTAWKLLPLLVAQPVVSLSYVETMLETGQMTSLRAVNTLVDRGVLIEFSGRRRNRVWRQADVLGVLDSFAEGLRRGSRRLDSEA